MKKYFLLGILIFMLSLNCVSALESLGTFKQGQTVRISQVCADATYINISSIASPNSVAMYANTRMTSAGAGEYYFNFVNTTSIGRYDVRGISDGCERTFAVYFDITPSGFTGGFEGTFGFYLILIAICSALVILGFSIKDGWFVVFGGLGLIGMGLYSINFGVAGFRDMFMTWTIGLFEMGVGSYLSIRSALEMMD